MLDFNKKYAVIYADPPWDVKYLKGIKNGVNKGITDYKVPYNTMTDEEIKAMPIKEITADDAVLFMWVIDSRINKINSLFNAWGFKYVTLGFVWNKIAAKTNGYNSVMSPYTRKSCELCFIGRKGKYIIKNPTVEQFISAVKGRHSEKPKAVYTKIETMVGDVPKLELFSRHRRESWDVFGDQLPKYIQKVLKC